MIRQAHQTGYILLPVIVVITLVAAIALLMNTESALESNTAASELDAQQAQYVAAAGLNHALWLTQQQGCGPYSDLTDEPLGSEKYSSKLTTDLGGTTAFTISVDQDSWIRSDLPTENKATDLKLHTRNEILGTERPLLRYDLSPLAAKAQILSATAWFYITNAHAAGPIDIHLTSADWTETDATWNSMNSNMDSAVLATIPSQPVIGVWIPVNLTAQVQAWVNGQPNFGITLNSTVDGVHGQYNSRESANPPYLEVVVGTPPTSPATLQGDGTLANGVQRSIKRKDVVLRQYPTSFVQWQHDAVQGVDAYIWESNPTTQNGNDDETWVSRSTNNTSLSLFKFNVDTLLPGTRILNATLSLLHESGNNSNVPVSAHRIVNPWVEADVTWRERVSGTDWDTLGGDLDERVVSTTLVGPTSNIRYEWDLTSLVQGWADNAYPNYGIALRTLQNGSIGERFYTSDETIETRRPRLTITYTCACGEVCVAPQGSGKLLMVVINPTILVPSDDAKKSLFESWGYTVSVVSESANQTAYDAAVAVNDVVFISETVNNNAVGSKLQNAPIGVVSQDGDYNADLGIAAGSNWTVDTAIDVTDTSHYITAPFATGPLEIYANGMEQLTVNGSEAADLQTLAESSGAGSLVVLDTGAALDGGGTAAGRRVMLPLGREGNFVWDQLNNNGGLIVQRALTWGAGLDAVKANPQLLLVVVNPSSLTTQESARKALIESWGYVVNLIDESDSQANFDAALAANAVVYIPETINPANVGTKLTAATIGIVNEEKMLLVELGFSGDFDSNNRNEIVILDNAHWITSGLALGTTAITTSNQPLTFTNNGSAPGAQTLAETNQVGSFFEPSLLTLETNAVLWGGGFAAGRRVLLPWGDSGFNINALNADGLTIMQRAIEWAGGSGCVSSQPLLLVVGDATTLSSKDDGMKTLIESWCYSVTLIDDGASQASFDAAAAAADVVYVSGTTSGPSIADKLTGSPTPIVNEINGKLDNFGFSSSTSTSITASAFSATDAAHYISEPFAGNPVTFFTTDLAMPVPGGTLASGLQTVGETTGATPALVTLDAGAQRWDGNPSPARRVHLPFTNADPSQLTADGKTLMLRAIEWASGSGVTGPIAHWKLDETSGPTAVDSEGGHDGTWTNGPAATPGVLDGALDFDGSNDYVDAGTFDVTGSGITMMGWFNAEAIATDDGRIVSKANGPNEADAWWQLSTTDSGSNRYLRMRIKASGTTTTFADSSVNLTTGQWYFAVGTYDNATGDMRLYLDGVEVANGSHALGGAIDTDAAVRVAIGANGTAERFFNGILDDVRVYDYALSASEISDLYTANAPLGPSSYTEMFQTWSATGDDTWQTVDLGAFGVPDDAVVEVAVINTDTGKKYFGGVRAVGSNLERRFQLHEAEGGGVDAVTMHVQADASSQIQHYSDKRSRVSFILLGYWTGATYVERFDAFKAGANASWQGHNLGAYGVAANQVAEIAMSQTSTSVEWLVGARSAGSILQRRIKLHEAENGGIDMVTLQVASDASSMIEVYAEANSVVDFHLLGYWSTPPGIYTETGGVHGQATVSAGWQTTDLSSFGIPANSIAQFVLSNEIDANENQMGLRETGSTINNRRLDLQEAESGGGDLGTMHVKVDASSQIQWAAEYGVTEGFFYPVGWWVLSP